MKACGAASTPPSTIVSRNFTRPSRTHGADLVDEGLAAVGVVADDEAAQRRRLPIGLRQLRGRRGGVVVVAGDRSAQGDAAAQAQGVDRRREVLAADVVEVDVDAVRRGLAQQLGDRAVVVVERGVEAELVAQPRDLLGRARRSRSRCGPRSFAICPASEPTAPAAPHTNTTSPSLQLRDVQQPDVGGQARHPEHAQMDARRGPLGVDACARARPSTTAYSRQPSRCSDEVALGEPVGPRRDDLADRAAVERRAELQRRQ